MPEKLLADLIHDTGVALLPIYDPHEMNLETVTDHFLIKGSLEEDTGMPFTKVELDMGGVSIDR